VVSHPSDEEYREIQQEQLDRSARDLSGCNHFATLHGNGNGGIPLKGLFWKE
jgi:hypothetical protein